MTCRFRSTAQTATWAAARGLQVVAEYIEPGASATDDRRPEFQRMVERACDGECAFDVVVVHSFSRFFRDAFGLEFYVRKLAKHNVKLVSITQELGDDPAQVMMRQVIALFDEYQSKENAKHVLRSMKENARQGFWNGSTTPFGYRTFEVERRGARIKKRLEIDEVEAEQVRLIFRLLQGGHGGQGPLGVKSIATWLNERGYARAVAGYGGSALCTSSLQTLFMAAAGVSTQSRRGRASARAMRNTSMPTRRPSLSRALSRRFSRSRRKGIRGSKRRGRSLDRSCSRGLPSAACAMAR